MSDIGYSGLLIALLTAAIGVNGLLMIWLSRSLHQVDRKFTVVNRQLHDLQYDWEANRIHVDSNMTAVLDQCHLDIDAVKSDVLSLRADLNDDLYELAEALQRVEELATHALNREYETDFVSKSALYTVRSDLEKLNAEVLRLRNRMEVRTSHGSRLQSQEFHAGRHGEGPQEALTAEAALATMRQRRHVAIASSAAKDPASEAVELNIPAISDSVN